VSLSDLLDCLGDRELTSLLVEGGGSLLASFFERRLVDKVLAFVAPLIIGGQDAPTPVRGMGAAHLRDAMCLERLSVEQVGKDVLLVAYPSANMRMSDS
jgi:diaminohydroxyphosphoribosylaminopyrimidine deaminase/5-amino-6-(5-phosphoribosylamino)uracil reductase